jgi:hypothetical protein
MRVPNTPSFNNAMLPAESERRIKLALMDMVCVYPAYPSTKDAILTAESDEEQNLLRKKSVSAYPTQPLRTTPCCPLRVN